MIRAAQRNRQFLQIGHVLDSPTRYIANALNFQRAESPDARVENRLSYALSRVSLFRVQSIRQSLSIRPSRPAERFHARLSRRAQYSRQRAG